MCTWAQPIAEPRPARLNGPISLVFRPCRGNRGGKSPPPPTSAAHRPNSAGRPTVVGRWGNSLGVAPGDGGFNLGQREAHRGSCSTTVGGRPEGYAGEVVGRRWLSRLVRMENNLELGRRYWWGRWGWRSTRGGGRWWPGYSSDGGSSGSKG
jgi:hypothetical protein